jgi:uncharacterized protein with PIN domain
MERFVADVHLGKLARLLRLLGFDTVYQNSFTTTELIGAAVNEARILLSRSTGFLKYSAVRSFIIKHEDPWDQLKQIVEHFQLKNQFNPFSRCIVCNGHLEKVPKQSILHLLEQNTIDYFSEFWRCPDCNRVYWKGSHYERMLKITEAIMS